MAPKHNKSLDNPKYLWHESPVRYTSISTVVAFIKDKTKGNPDLRKDALKNWDEFTQKIMVGSRSHQRINKKKQFHYILGTSKNHLFLMDICDLFGTGNRERISKLNGNNLMQYILIIINSLTKYVYAYPLLNRTNKVIIDVLKSAFKDMGVKECDNKKYFKINIQVDKEFIVGKDLQTFFKHYCVNVYYSQSDHKASMAERWVKYVKESLASRMEGKRTEVWVPLLKDVVKQYNTLRKHSTTRMTPKTAEKYPSAAFIRIVEKNRKSSTKHPLKKTFKFKIGDRVRLLVNSQNVFRKNYQARFTYDTWLIYQRRKVDNQYVYYLQGRRKEILKGSFREDLLRLASIEGEVYPYKRLEEGKGEKEGQTKVHWEGFGDSEDEWVPNENLT